VVTGPSAGLAQQPYLLAPNNRASTNAATVGNPASRIEGGRARPMDRMDRTLREHAHVPSQLGVATPYIKGARVTGTEQWLDRESKRHDQILAGWMPAPNMASALGAVRDSLHGARERLEMPSGSALPTTQFPLGVAPLGQPTGTYNKLPSQNVRMDLGLAHQQLRNNDLAIRIN
jgi:hypothetical protein